MNLDILLRIFLIVCATLVLFFMIRRVLKAELRARDTIFWFVFTACLIAVSVFPQIAFLFSGLLGFESPANFVFLLVVAILVIRLFIMTIETAKLREKVDILTQEIALSKHSSNTKDKN